MKPIVRVEWIDAQDHPLKWVDSEDAEKFGDTDCGIVSVGYLISKTDRYVTLAGDWDETDQDHGRVTKIPTKTVMKIEELFPAPAD